jgi:integrase/recombinase XerD
MLSQKLQEILRDWWRVEKPRHWLFPGDIDGRHITRDAVELACQKALLRFPIRKPVTPHSLRHASAYYTTFQSLFILKAIALDRAQSAAVYGRYARRALAPARLATGDPFGKSPMARIERPA